MATQNEHRRLIAAAAKAALAPTGCVRRGQSRVWFSDQRYWAIMIEFQPSGFSRGSYLNVGASWLWYDKGRGGLVFDAGYRVERAGFISFETTEQFRPLIERMADHAAEEVLALRAKFASIAKISHILNAEPNRQWSHTFSAAVAAGLNRESELSRGRFHEILSYAVSHEWHERLHSEAAVLAALLDDTGQFRAAARRTIDARRGRARLPLIADCLEGLDSTAS